MSQKKIPSFEAQLEKLEALQECLENGELGLDESIRLYEEGVKQLRLCRERLASYEAKIEELASPEESGES